MTLASVVISAASRSPPAALRSAKLSTSPFSAAVTYGPGLALDLEAVDRVGVGLADDADARPARVPEDQRRRPIPRQGQAQQVVGQQVGPHRGGVVAELADLGRRLVHEAEVPLGGAHRLRSEEVVAGPAGDEAGHRGVGQIEAVVADEHGEPGAVAAAHLEAVEGGERLLDGRADLDGRPGRFGSHQLPHARGGGEPVPHHRPQRVLQAGAARRWRPRACARPAHRWRRAAPRWRRSSRAPRRRRPRCGWRRRGRGRAGRRRRWSATGRRAPRAARPPPRRRRRDPARRAPRWTALSGSRTSAGSRSTRAPGPRRRAMMPHTHRSLPVSSGAPEGLDGGHQPSGRRLGRLGGGGLDHHADERLRAAPAHEDAPVIAELGLHRRDLARRAARRGPCPCPRPGRCAAPAGVGSWRRRPARRAASRRGGPRRAAARR